MESAIVLHEPLFFCISKALVSQGLKTLHLQVRNLGTENEIELVWESVPGLAYCRFRMGEAQSGHMPPSSPDDSQVFGRYHGARPQFRRFVSHLFHSIATSDPIVQDLQLP